MQLTIRILGCELLYVDLSDSTPEQDPTRDLSGGYLGSAPIEAGKTALYLGFTNGRGDEET